LEVNGHFFVKVFQGEMFNQYLDDIRKLFSTVKVVKPRASRKASAEIYLLGLNYTSP